MAAADSTPGSVVDEQTIIDATSDHVPQWQLEAQPENAGDFTADLRPAARRRRFVRSGTTPLPDDVVLDAATPARETGRAAQTEHAAPVDRAPATSWRDAVPATAATPAQPQSHPTDVRADGLDGLRRLIDRQHSMLVELSQLSARVVEASELAVRETLRADHAEAELANAQQRLLAARGLVGEAQKTAHVAAERAAYAEGRSDALQSALDEALHGGWFARRRLRRTHA